MAFVISRRALDTAIEPGGTSSWVRDALLAWVAKFASRDSDYERDRLHTGSDLSPDSCARKSWYGVHGTPRDPMTLGDAFRLYGGEFWESVMVQAFKAMDPTLLTQVVIQPLRPGAWAWAPGHGDMLSPAREHLTEVKAPRARLFDYAKSDATRLVKTQYRWQLSRYFHELKRRSRAKTASFLFIDREGSHQPIEVPLEGELLIPLGAIIDREIELAPLLTTPEPPPRIGPSLVVKVWKGGRATKAKPNPERRVLAVEKRAWQCSYCAFAQTCQPGPEERVLGLAPDSPWRLSALQDAESAWARGDKKTPQVSRFGGQSDPETEDAEEPASADTDEPNPVGPTDVHNQRPF